MPSHLNEGSKTRPAPLPPPESCQVWIDFDGTITRRDVLDDLILKYAVDDSWKGVEELWQSGQIGSRECLEREFALLRISDSQLEAFLNRVELDPGFESLLKTLDRYSVPRAIVSDGIDPFIRKILARHGVSELPVRANTIVRAELAMSLSCPHGSAKCESAAAHCKCESMVALATPNRKSIYIGDGRSDLCPARKAEVVFAKGALAAVLKKEGRDFIPFATLHDVAAVLANAWSEISREGPKKSGTGASPVR